MRLTSDSPRCNCSELSVDGEKRSVHHHRLLLHLILLTALIGCAGFIKGVTNTNFYKAADPSASYTIEAASGDSVIGRKIARMLDYQMQKLGFTQADSPASDMKVLFAFDVVPAGAVSRARTRVYQPSSTSGSTVATATTTVTTTQLFDKSIAVRMVESSTGETLWEGLTTERGWCNQILLSAPAILSLMFQDFPGEQTNARERRSVDAPEAREFKALFPKDTDWSCR